MNYVICFVNRSGSNYLCDLLKSAGIGNPTEYYFPCDFQRRVNSQFAANNSFNPRANNPQEYWRRVRESQGAVVGLKAHWESFQAFRSEVDIRGLDLKYIYLTRKDKLRQAISWYRAVHTKKWSRFDTPIQEDPEFDRTEIDNYLAAIGRNERNWERFLADKNPLRLIYEELGPQTVSEVADYLGVAVTRAPHSGFFIQRDEKTDEFVRLYQKPVP